MTRFRPAVESLDARTLPSAVLATTDAPPAEAALVGTAGQPAAEQSLSLNYTKITLQDVLVSGKVAVQDFSFTAKINKASPIL